MVPRRGRGCYCSGNSLNNTLETVHGCGETRQEEGMLWLRQRQLTQPIHNHIVEVDGKELEFLLKRGSRR